MRWSRSSRSAVALAALLVCAGCVIVPTPRKARGPLGRADLAGELERMAPRGESLEALLLRLGDPADAGIDGRWLAWEWRIRWGWFFGFVPVGAGPAPAPAMLPLLLPLETERVLVVSLDADARVSGTSVRKRRWSEAERFDVLALAPEPPAQYRGEPVEFAGRVFWMPESDALPAELVLVVTPSGLHFKAPGAFGPAPAELTLRFAEIRDVALERPLGIGAQLRLELVRGGGMRLQISSPDAWAALDVSASERLLALILARSAR